MLYCRGKYAQQLSPGGLCGCSTSAPHGGRTSERGAYGHLYLGGSAGLTTTSEGDYATLLRDRRGTPGAVGGYGTPTGSAASRGPGERSIAEVVGRGQRT